MMVTADLLIRRDRSAHPVILLAAFILLPMAVFFPTPASASSANFAGIASADGATLSVALEDFLVVERNELAGPRAQAVVGTVEGSNAFAAHPALGENAGFALSAVEGGTGVPIPRLLTVKSTYPAEPETNQELGPVSLKAVSSEMASRASGQSGVTTDVSSLGLTRAQADVKYDAVSGNLHVKASSVASGLVFNDVLKIGTIESRATVTANESSGVTRRSSFDVTAVSVAGQPIELDLSGDGPIPQEDPVAGLLREHGIALEIVEREESKTGVVSAGLRISMTQAVPNAPKPAIITYEFGRVAAHADVVGGLNDPADASIDVSESTQAPVGSVPDDGPDVGVTERSEPSSTGADAGFAPVPDTEAAAPKMQESVPAVAAPAQAASVRGPLVAEPSSWLALYLSIGVAAGFAVVSAQAVRSLGMRRVWPS